MDLDIHLETEKVYILKGVKWIGYHLNIQMDKDFHFKEGGYPLIHLYFSFKLLIASISV